MISILKNLAPEEVEYVIQRSAFNVDSPGYDILTGWGRLNAGGALEIVDTAKRKLHHFDSDSLTHTSILSLAASNTNLRLREKARNNTGLLFDHKYYKADVYKVTCTIPLPLSANDSIVAYWARNSSSDLYNYDATDSLLPHERITFEAIDTNTVVLSGYLVHLYDSATHTSLGWLPRDTSNYSDINFAISALTGDTIPNWNNIEEVKTRHSRLSLYPNPADDYAVIEAATDCGENVKLEAYNTQGQVIQSIFRGQLKTPNRFMLKTKELSAGTYFVVMQTSCENKFIKFFKL